MPNIASDDKHCRSEFYRIIPNLKCFADIELMRLIRRLTSESLTELK